MQGVRACALRRDGVTDSGVISLTAKLTEAKLIGNTPNSITLSCHCLSFYKMDHKTAIYKKKLMKKSHFLLYLNRVPPIPLCFLIMEKNE
jgi:hypothetical protein